MSPTKHAPPDPRPPSPLTRLTVPLMLTLSSLFMALAWIGHLRFEEMHYLAAVGLCWLTVLPEYCLNVRAIRVGYAVYTGAQMASFNLASGVVCLALVARYVLNEPMGPRQVAGFLLMLVAMPLIVLPSPERRAESRSRSAARNPAEDAC